MPKFYWILCGVILVVGVSIALISAEWPGLVFSGDPESGEMPLEFGAGLGLAFLAIVGFVGGLIAKIVLTLLRK
ncbi:hypothetical protein [Yersinia aleksiciae]|nr:hypothetical protein [Yersinia aleksiciae]CFQ51963.1 Uncharacterised protein [Yersinia aleksiciae]